MQTCNCSNSYKYKSACVICGAPWASKTLDEYILELKKTGEEIRSVAFKNNDIEMRNKYCLIRDIYTELEDIAKYHGDKHG